MKHFDLTLNCVGCEQVNKIKSQGTHACWTTTKLKCSLCESISFFRIRRVFGSGKGKVAIKLVKFDPSPELLEAARVQKEESQEETLKEESTKVSEEVSDK